MPLQPVYLRRFQAGTAEARVKTGLAGRHRYIALFMRVSGQPSREGRKYGGYREPPAGMPETRGLPAGGFSAADAYRHRELSPRIAARQRPT